MTNSHLHTYREPTAHTNRLDYPPSMSSWFDARELHETVFNAHEPLIRLHWARALGVASLERSIQIEVDHPLTFTLDEIQQDNERFENFRLAVLYDTMRRVTDETQGGDDSTYDYSPDGGEQIRMMLDVDGFAPFVRRLVELHAFTPDPDGHDDVRLSDIIEKEFGPSIYFQDCTSPLFIDTIRRVTR